MFVVIVLCVCVVCLCCVFVLCVYVRARVCDKKYVSHFLSFNEHENKYLPSDNNRPGLTYGIVASC